MTIRMPLARAAELIIQEVDRECLIYDLSRNKALSLNEVSAEIWKYCDGSTSVTDVAAIIGSKARTKIDEDFIWLAIADLEKNHLLEGEVKRPTEFDNLSRRKVLLKYTLLAMAIPVILSIVAPTSAQVGTQGAPPTCLNPGRVVVPGVCFDAPPTANAACCSGVQNPNGPGCNITCV